MFRHYVKTSVRALLRKPMYTVINVVGLAVGLALALVVLGHVSHEVSFEDFHVNKDRIHRIEGRYVSEDDDFRSAAVMAPLGHAMVAETPEVERAAVFRVRRITSVRVGEERRRIKDEYEGACYAHHKKVIFADPDYLRVFTFPLLEGDPQAALTEPFSVLITQRAAEEYWPGKDPMGQMIRINDDLDCRVTGILENIPQNTQLYCDFIISYATLERVDEDIRSWTKFGTDYAYLLLKERADPEVVAAKIPSVVAAHMPPEELSKYSFKLKPLKKIYFSVYTDWNRGEIYPAGEASMIYTLLIVAAFIVLQAVANFVNLSTAKAADRMKEVGVRKVLGAFRTQLARQFIGESLIISLAAGGIGLILYELFRSQVYSYLPRKMFADFYGNPLMILGAIGVIVPVSYTHLTLPTN